jgi:hypothetical protein
MKSGAGRVKFSGEDSILLSFTLQLLKYCFQLRRELSPEYSRLIGARDQNGKFHSVQELPR